MDNKIKFEIKVGEYSFSFDEITKFLTKMFKDKDASKITIIPEEKTLKIEVRDELGNLVTDTICPPNIKEGTILGYYYLEKKLCLLPLRDGRFVLKRGCKHNKVIRPLFSLYKMRKEREHAKIV